MWDKEEDCRGSKTYYVRGHTGSLKKINKFLKKKQVQTSIKNSNLIHTEQIIFTINVNLVENAKNLTVLQLKIIRSSLSDGWGKKNKQMVSIVWLLKNKTRHTQARPVTSFPRCQQLEFAHAFPEVQALFYGSVKHKTQTETGTVYVSLN